jgi:4-amino-4-deoxy-L-arabinose transferase-like glycosyltransferase
MDDSIEGRPISAWRAKTTDAWDVALALVLVVATGLLLLNLPHWPPTWYDEGVSLQASKNLVLHGRYGLRHGSEVRVFDPLISVGPTVTLPVALSFKVFGIGLVQARAVMVLFAVAALGSFMMLARHVFGAPTAVVAALWLLAFPSQSVDVTASFLGLGRTALGEVPALLLVSAGAIVWFSALDRRSDARLLAAGLLFGLAVVTKQQAALVLVALAGTWLVDRCWHRQLAARHVGYPLGLALTCLLAWSIVLRCTPGSSYDEQVLSAGSRVQTLALTALASPGLMISNLGALSASGVLTWGLPGLIYGLCISQERSLGGVKRSFVLVIAATWLLWFVVASIGWLRYAVIGVAMMTVFTARLLVDLAGGFDVWGRHDAASGRPAARLSIGRNLAVTSAVVFMVAWPLQRIVRHGPALRDTTAIQFASELDRLVPPDAVVECFEAEIVFLSARSFSQPTSDAMIAATRHVALGHPYRPGFYRPDASSTYLVNGPVAKRAGIYARYLHQGCCTRVHEWGDYELYQVTEVDAFR